MELIFRSVEWSNNDCVYYYTRILAKKFNWILVYCWFVDLHVWRCMPYTEMLLCHSIEISISLECLYQSSPFFHHCKGKSMTYLEMDIICSRFFLFLKYDSHPMIVFFFFFFFLTHPVYMCCSLKLVNFGVDDKLLRNSPVRAGHNQVGPVLGKSNSLFSGLLQVRAKNNGSSGHEKKKPCFTGGRTFRVGVVHFF